MRKKLLVTAVIVVVALGAGVAGAQVQQRFNDVPTDHYAYEAVNWAVAAGITVGCGDGTNFCPERNLNRAHMVTFLKRYDDWVQNGRPYPNAEGAGANLACLTSEAGCDITLASLGIEIDKVLIVGVDIAPGRWRIADGGRDEGFSILTRDILTHPSYPGPSQHWPDWFNDLRSLPEHGYRQFEWERVATRLPVIQLELTDFAVIYRR